MKRIKELIFIFIMLMSFSACFNNDNSSLINSSLSSSSSSSEVKKDYIKDEEGFFILEDDYFKNTSKEDGKNISKVRYSKTLDESLKYKQLRMFIGEDEVPVMNTKTNMSQTWNGEAPSRMNNAVSIIELEGKIEVKLQANFALLGECVIRPLSAKITPKIDENRRVISFEISSPGQYTVELRSKRTFHLFVNEYKEYEKYKNESNVLYFGPGVHTKDNSKYIGGDSKIYVSDYQTVFLDLGAVVQAAFFANSRSNVKIVGSGAVDGSVFSRSVANGTTKVPFEFNYCSNLLFDGIAMLDPAGWCYNLYFCNNVELNNIKIISSRSNGDGVSVQSCQNVTCKNSFVRSWDDSLVVKNYPRWDNRSIHGTTKNIVFENCIIWTDLAQSMEVGYETVGQVMEDITFNNIIVLHNFHKAVISIHNANNSKIKRVKFKNITVEDCSTGQGDGNNIFIDIANIFSNNWSTNHTITSLGSIDGVEVENVKVIDGNDNPLVNVSGTIDNRKEYNNSYHYVNNVLFKDVIIKDKILDKNYSNLNINLANNITFERTSKDIVGASINYKDSSSYGSNYQVESI